LVFFDDCPKVAYRFQEIRIIRHPNAGVAGSWNEIIKLFPAPWWMLVNNDIAFAPGDLDRMAAFVASNPDVAACYGNHGASWWAVTRPGVHQVGLFDENFYPAYLEDCDWAYRADLVKAVRLNVPDCHAIHGDAERGETGSCTIMADPAVRAENHRTHGLNFTYYREKWGGNNGEEIYRTPFDQPGYPIQAWQFYPNMRANNTWHVGA
jgi:hypothetical protein